jgi:predicted transcriptional regulator
MPISEPSVRQSVTLPPPVARRVRALAKTKRTSASRVITELIQTGLDAVDQEKQHFFALADGLTASRSPAEKKKIKEELARMTFGE